MLTGRIAAAAGFNPAQPQPTDGPSIAAIAGDGHAAAEQPAAGGRAARPDRPQHRPRPPRPVRRADGRAPRPVVHRGVAVRQHVRTARSRSTSSTTKNGATQAEASLPGCPTCRCRRAWTSAASAGRTGLLLRTSPHQRQELDGVAQTETFDRFRQGAISLLTDADGAAGVRRDPGRRQHAGPLRPQRLRLVAADGAAAGRGGREPGAGEPRQQRDVGHARQRLPAPEGQAVPADRPARVGAARRPGRDAACSTAR